MSTLVGPETERVSLPAVGWVGLGWIEKYKRSIASWQVRQRVKRK